MAKATGGAKRGVTKAPSRSRATEGEGFLGSIGSPVFKYIVLPIVAIAGIYLVVKSLFLGGGQAFLDSFKTQLEHYTEKMDGYAKQNNGVLTQAQQASRDDEVKLMNDALANAQQAFNNPYEVIGVVATIMVSVWAFFYGADKFNALRQKWGGVADNPQTKPKTAKGAAKMMECVLVDGLAAEGFMTTATNFFTQIQNSWYAVDVPSMQSIMSSLQMQIDAGILSGIQLAMAQATIQSYTFEIAMMPSVFALPLLEYRGR